MRAWLRTGNPRADILTSGHGDIDVRRLLAPPVQAREARRVESACAGVHPGGHGNEVHHSPGIDTVFLPIPDPIGWEAYAGIVGHLQQGDDAIALRAKGLVRIAGESGLMIVQGVRRLFAPPAFIADDATARTGLVLIGERLDRALLMRTLARFGVRMEPAQPPR